MAKCQNTDNKIKSSNLESGAKPAKSSFPLDNRKIKIEKKCIKWILLGKEKLRVERKTMKIFSERLNQTIKSYDECAHKKH